MAGSRQHHHFKPFTYDESTAFLDQNGAKIDPSALVAGSKIVIRQGTFPSAKKPVIVQVKSGVVNKNGTGTRRAWIRQPKSLVLKIRPATWKATHLGRQPGRQIPKSAAVPSELKKRRGDQTVKNNIETVEVTHRAWKRSRRCMKSGRTMPITCKRDGGQLEKLRKLLAENRRSSSAESPLTSAILNADETNAAIRKVETAESAGSGNENPGIEPPNGTEKGATVVQYEPKSRVLTLMDANKKPCVVTLDENQNSSYKPNASEPTLGRHCAIPDERPEGQYHVPVEPGVSIDVIFTNMKAKYLALNFHDQKADAARGGRPEASRCRSTIRSFLRYTEKAAVRSPTLKSAPTLTVLC
ncbi:hypothetical protein VQ056_21600 [Paenibacillus sp. JTLBN-2024]